MHPSQLLQADLTGKVVAQRFKVLLTMLLLEGLCAYLYGALFLFPMPLWNTNTWWAAIPKHAVGLFELPAAILVLALLIMSPRLPRRIDELKQASEKRRGFLLGNLLAVGLVGLLSVPLFHKPQAMYELEGLVSVAWTLSVFAAVTAGFLMLAPLKAFVVVLKQEWKAVFLAIFISAIGRYFAKYFSNLAWDGALSHATLNLVIAILRLFFPGLTADPADFRIEANGFAVRVLSGCSGYEGILLVTGFLGVYFSVFWRELNLRRAVWLVPIAIVFSWLLNALRIATIVLLGAYVSPDLAMQGFHSRAGWIFFLVLAVTFTVALRSRYFERTKAATTAMVVAPTDTLEHRGVLDEVTAFYIPLLVLLASTLVLSAFSTEFQWLYPLRVISTGLALAYCWKPLAWPSMKWSAQSMAFPVLTGVAVFGVWLALIPASAIESGKFATQLARMPIVLQISWIVFRCAGAAITVPLAEELAFRGYVMAALSGKNVLPAAQLRFNWIAFILSSLFFGALHGQWIAGTLAGMAYALVRYRTQRVADAVVAHGVTNGLLCIYVLVTGYWSYW